MKNIAETSHFGKAPGNLADALETLAHVIAAIVVDKLRDGQFDGDTWIESHDSPLGHRRTRELCACGTFKTARKLSRRWYVRKSELDAFIDAQNTERQAAPVLADNAEQEKEAGVNAFLGEIGFKLAKPLNRRPSRKGAH